MEKPEISPENADNTAADNNTAVISPEKTKEIKENRELEKLMYIRNIVKTLTDIVINQKSFDKFSDLLKTDLLNNNRPDLLLIPTLIKNFNNEIVYDLREISKIVMKNKKFSKKEIVLKTIEIQNNIQKIYAYYYFICKTTINTNFESCILIDTYNENTIYEFFFYLKLLTNSLIKTLLNI
ncbi:MAG: hypothetical protein QXU98_05970 [Candidatus Parvarchaeota archaeon]